MNTFTADAVVQSVLVTLTEPTEIRTSGGEVLGYYTPAPDQIRKARTPQEERLYAEARELLDPEELARRKARNEPGITTAELLAKLQRLESH